MRNPLIRPILYFLLLFGAAFLAMPAPSSAQISFGVTITTGPPEIPVYDQPECPGDDYLWVPGYWSWDDGDYYWVPGTWVMAPEPGYLWTPGYWAWGGSSFVFYEGYWGPEVGFYGGIDYGFGYFGHGYEGGRWDRGHFFYNRAVNNINVTIVHNNVYNTPFNGRRGERIGFNGGRGGITDRPDSQEERASRDRHVAPVAAQVQHVQAARSDRDLRASVNKGRPNVAATPRAGVFDRGGDRGGQPSGNNGGNNGNNNGRPGEFDRGAGGNNAVNPSGQPSGRDNNVRLVHPKDLPPVTHMPAPNTGNQRMDQKYQQQQEKLAARQDQDRQKLEQKQDQEHQRLTQQKANDARQQQVEQKHEQQTQKLTERHTQQQQQMQQREQPRGSRDKKN